MRAKLKNETDNRLKIFLDKDGTYSAKENSILYTFFWKSYNVYNFKKIGKILNTYNISGTKINNPPIQMILQIQRKINESLNNKDIKSLNIE